ncbi:MAG TPA: radical SAM family heme chaperone HemW [Candidatus Cloacimonadota bacterium]|nr:radical SAM family heme chaperone HemW [Candidatus Cloacimonadota bacterium]
MESHISPGPLGLYVHIPFCLTRCPYCAFFSLPFSRERFEHYLKILNQEKELYRSMIDRPLRSVYFGGGTPSLMSASQINAILQDMPFEDDAEISLEINPIQVNPQYITELKSTPINRLSLGIQSFNDEDLKWLQRRHKAADIAPRIKLLRDGGFSNISLDYIYGLPNSSLESVRTTLEQMIELEPDHLSSYLLEIYDDSPIVKFRNQIPQDEVLADQYEMICSMLEAAGLRQYEVSNFAREGCQSKHNLLYWKRNDYLAWGAGASGYFQGQKYQNPADLELYEEGVLAHRIFPGAIENTLEDDEWDYTMMRLRLIEGLNFAEYRMRYGRDFGREQAIRKLADSGVLIADTKGIRISPKGLFISNYIISELL